VTSTKNRFDLNELAGAFGDLGTLIPFVAAYISVVRWIPAASCSLWHDVDRGGLDLPHTVSGTAHEGHRRRRHYPDQPDGGTDFLHGDGRRIVTGLIWLLLGMNWLGASPGALGAASGVDGGRDGARFSFMLEGIRMMAQSPWIGAGLLVLTLVLLAPLAFPGNGGAFLPSVQSLP